MALKLVVDAVEARLAAGWSRCPVVSVNLNKKPPPDGSAHLVVQYPAASSRPISIGAPGANIYREEGAFRILVNMPKGDGQEQGLQWADELAALFRGRRFGGVETFAPSSPALDDRNDAGNFFQLSIAVPYEADVIG